MHVYIYNNHSDSKDWLKDCLFFFLCLTVLRCFYFLIWLLYFLKECMCELWVTGVCCADLIMLGGVSHFKGIVCLLWVVALVWEGERVDVSVCVGERQRESVSEQDGTEGWLMYTNKSRFLLSFTVSLFFSAHIFQSPLSELSKNLMIKWLFDYFVRCLYAQRVRCRSREGALEECG